MHRTFTLLTIAAFALSLAGGADAASSCRDSKGKFIKCPAASAPAASATSAAKPASATASSSGPNCKKGKRCGNACISVNDVCHK